MRVYPAITLSLLILGSLLTPHDTLANISEWDYDNYLYSLEILSCDDAVIMGLPGSITVEVGANTAVSVHFEFKGSFCWGDWTYTSEKTTVKQGTSVIKGEVGIPLKTLVDPTCRFYYYVYVTFPDMDWTPGAWGQAQEVTLLLPDEVSLADMIDLVSHLKWKVETSELPDRVKQSFLSKLDRVEDRIIEAYETGNEDRVYRFLEFLLVLKQKYCGENNHSSTFYQDLMAEQVEYFNGTE
jgi:hypothetical protein